MPSNSPEDGPLDAIPGILRRRRIALDLSQAEVAEAANIDASRISKYEGGTRAGVGTLNRWMAALGINSLDELLENKQSEESVRLKDRLARELASLRSEVRSGFDAVKGAPSKAELELRARIEELEQEAERTIQGMSDAIVRALDLAGKGPVESRKILIKVLEEWTGGDIQGEDSAPKRRSQ